MYDDEIPIIVIYNIIGYVRYLYGGMNHIVNIPGRSCDSIGVPDPRCGTG
jgi:hypothetical protein